MYKICQVVIETRTRTIFFSEDPKRLPRRWEVTLRVKAKQVIIETSSFSKNFVYKMFFSSTLNGNFLRFKEKFRNVSLS